MSIKKNLLFTNVGDNTDFYEKWISQYISYDIFVNYYGSSQNSDLFWKENISGFSRIKNWKFNSLNELFKNKEIDLSKYAYIAILDDDIILDKYDINSCFDYMEKYDLYFCCPSFKNIDSNKIINNEFIQNNKNKLRYTNLIDIRVCFVKTSILIEFLNNYNNELYDFGFEYLLLKNYYKLQNKIAIIDSVSCINPDKTKSDIFSSLEERKEKFEKLLESNEIILFDITIHSNIINNEENNSYLNNHLKSTKILIENNNTKKKANTKKKSKKKISPQNKTLILGIPNKLSNQNTIVLNKLSKKPTKNQTFKKTTSKSNTIKKNITKKHSVNKKLNNYIISKKNTNKKQTNKKQTNKKQTNKK